MHVNKIRTSCFRFDLESCISGISKTGILRLAWFQSRKHVNGKSRMITVIEIVKNTILVHTCRVSVHRPGESISQYADDITAILRRCHGELPWQRSMLCYWITDRHHRHTCIQRQPSFLVENLKHNYLKLANCIPRTDWVNSNLATGLYRPVNT